MDYRLTPNAQEYGALLFLPIRTYQGYKNEYDDLLKKIGIIDSVYFLNDLKLVQIRIKFPENVIFRIDYYNKSEYDQLFDIAFIEIEKSNPVYELNRSPIYIKKQDLEVIEV